MVIEHQNPTNLTAKNGAASKSSDRSMDFVLFIETNLGHNFAITASDSDTVCDLKRRIVFEYAQCFPEMGEINVLAIKINLEGISYHLSGSIPVGKVFETTLGARSLHVDASSTCKHNETNFLNTCKQHREERNPIMLGNENNGSHLLQSSPDIPCHPNRDDNPVGVNLDQNVDRDSGRTESIIGISENCLNEPGKGCDVVQLQKEVDILPVNGQCGSIEQDKICMKRKDMEHRSDLHNVNQSSQMGKRRKKKKEKASVHSVEAKSAVDKLQVLSEKTFDKGENFTIACKGHREERNSTMMGNENNDSHLLQSVPGITCHPNRDDNPVGMNLDQIVDRVSGRTKSIIGISEDCLAEAGKGIDDVRVQKEVDISHIKKGALTVHGQCGSLETGKKKRERKDMKHRSGLANVNNPEIISSSPKKKRHKRKKEKASVEAKSEIDKHQALSEKTSDISENFTMACKGHREERNPTTLENENNGSHLIQSISDIPCHPNRDDNLVGLNLDHIVDRVSGKTKSTIGISEDCLTEPGKRIDVVGVQKEIDISHIKKGALAVNELCGDIEPGKKSRGKKDIELMSDLPNVNKSDIISSSPIKKRHKRKKEKASVEAKSEINKHQALSEKTSDKSENFAIVCRGNREERNPTTLENENNGSHLMQSIPDIPCHLNRDDNHVDVNLVQNVDRVSGRTVSDIGVSEGCLAEPGKGIDVVRVQKEVDISHSKKGESAVHGQCGSIEQDKNCRDRNDIENMSNLKSSNQSEILSSSPMEKRRKRKKEKASVEFNSDIKRPQALNEKTSEKKSEGNVYDQKIDPVMREKNLELMPENIPKERKKKKKKLSKTVAVVASPSTHENSQNKCDSKIVLDHFSLNQTGDNPDVVEKNVKKSFSDKNGVPKTTDHFVAEEKNIGEICMQSPTLNAESPSEEEKMALIHEEEDLMNENITEPVLKSYPDSKTQLGDPVILDFRAPTSLSQQITEHPEFLDRDDLHEDADPGIPLKVVSTVPLSNSNRSERRTKKRNDRISLPEVAKERSTTSLEDRELQEESTTREKFIGREAENKKMQKKPKSNIDVENSNFTEIPCESTHTIGVDIPCESIHTIKETILNGMQGNSHAKKFEKTQVTMLSALDSQALLNNKSHKNEGKESSRARDRGKVDVNVADGSASLSASRKIPGLSIFDNVNDDLEDKNHGSKRQIYSSSSSSDSDADMNETQKMHLHGSQASTGSHGTDISERINVAALTSTSGQKLNLAALLRHSNSYKKAKLVKSQTPSEEI